MKSFRNFLEERDPELLKEGPWDWLYAAKGAAALPDIGISGVGGTGKQFLRGAGNVLAGLGRAGAGGLAMLGGEKGRKWGMGQLGKGALQTLGGTTQAMASPVTGVVRGVQAARDPYSDELVPTTGKVGQFFGWGKAPEKPRQDVVYQRGRGIPPSEESPEVAATMAGQTGDRKALIKQWQAAKGNPQLRAHIENIMKQNWPEWFQRAQEQLAARRQRAATA